MYFVFDILVISDSAWSCLLNGICNKTSTEKTLSKTDCLKGIFKREALTKCLEGLLFFALEILTLLKSIPTSAYAVSLPSPQPASRISPFKDRKNLLSLL